MRWVVLWLFVILRHMPLYAQECDIGDWSVMKDIQNIEDTDNFLILEVANVQLEKNEVEVSMCKGMEIVRHEVEDNKLLFYTQNMRAWEAETPNQDSLLLECFNVKFSCSEIEKKVTMKIEDLNNFVPTFVDDQGVAKPVYEFTLPMPFPASFPLDSFGSIIMAKDEDYTNKHLTFTIETNKDLLDIQYVETTDKLKKMHKASLKSKVPLDFNEMDFDIKVQDDGDESSLAKIRIKKDSQNSFVVPEFDKSYYMGNYDKDGMSNMQDEIILKNGEDVKIVLEGAFASYFKTKITGEKISIEQEKPLDETNDQNVIFTMKATNSKGHSDEATVIIEPIASNLPTFDKSYYLGNLHIDNAIVKHEIISVVVDEKAKIDITEEDIKKIFTAEIIDKHVIIGLSQNAKIEDIEDVDVVIPLKITNNDGGAAIAIVVFEVVRKPVEPISFSKTNYQGELNVDTNEIHIDPQIQITKGEVDDAKIIEGEYASKFEVTIEQTTQIINLKLKEKLENVDQPGLMLTLEVSNELGQSSKATVVLKFTGKSIQAQLIKFDKIYYKGEVDVSTQKVNIPDKIEIIEGDVADVRVIDTVYKEYFKVSLSADKKFVTIDLDKTLPSIPDSSIVLVLEAFNAKNDVGRTTVFLEVEENPISFTELFYKGILNKNPAEVQLDKTIEISKGNVETVKIVDGEHKEFFKASLSADKKTVTIELEENLPEINEASIVLTIEASNSNKEVGKTIVVLEVYDEIVEENPIIFTELFYKGNLNKDTEEVQLDKNIEISKGNVETVKIVDGEHKEFFKASLSADKKTVTIELEENLPEINVASIVLTIEASNANKEVGKTIVVLEVSDETVEENPITFTELFYKGILNTNPAEVQLDKTIEISKGNAETVKIVDGEHKEFFKASLSADKKTVTIELEENLPEINVASIVLTIEASNANKEVGKTIVVLEVSDETVEENPITFTELFYKGILNKNPAEVQLDKTIEISKGNAETVKIVDGEHKEFFKASLSADKKTVTIELEENLPEINVASIVLTIKASNANKEVGKTIVVLEVSDETVEENPITFTELFYKGILNTNPAEVQLDKTIEISKGNAETVKIVDGEHKEFFKASLSADKKTVTIELEESLPEINVASIVLTIEVSNANKQVGKTIVVLEVSDVKVEENPITFTELFYKGYLNKDTEEVQLDKNIEISKGNVETVKIVDGEHKEFFKASLSADKKTVTIELEENLPEINVASIVLTIEASNANKEVGKTIVVLEVSDETVEANPITFTELFYKGILNTNPAEVQLDKTIEISKGNAETVKIVDGEHKEFFKASLSADKKTVTIELEENLPQINEASIVLTIEVSNANKQVGKTFVVLEVSDETVEENPITFTELFYKGILHKDSEEVQLDKNIEISKGNAETVKIVDGEHKDFFKASLSADKKTVTIELEENLPEINVASIVLTIEVSNANKQVGKTFVVLEVSDVTVEENPITFTELFYKGLLNKDTEEIQLDKNIEISKGNAESVKIVDGEHKEFFKASLSADKKTVIIELEENLPQINEASIVLTIEASNANKEVGKTIVVLEVSDETVEENPIIFTELFYKGILNKNPAEVQLDKTIEISKGNAETVKIVDGEHKEFFKASLSADKKTVIIELEENLPEINVASIVLTIEASNANKEVGKTIVVLEVSDETVEANPITFTELFYKGILNTNPAEVQLDKTIEISKGNAETVKIVDGEHKEFFKASLSADKKTVTIELEDNLPQINKASIVLTIEVSNANKEVGKTIVVLEVSDATVEENPITFTELFYKGILHKDSEEVQLDKNIEISKGNAETVKIVDGEHKEFFKASLSADKKTVTIELEDNLPQINEASIVLTIEVSNANKQVGKTFVVLEVSDETVEENPITFTELFYKGILHKDSEEVQLDKNIEISKGNAETVKIVDGEHKEFFKASLSADKKTVKIELEDNLPQINEASIVLTIEVSNANKQVGKTFVVLEVSDETVEENPIIFTELFYKGILHKDSEEVELDKNIEISKGNAESVKIVDGEHKEFFKASLSADKKTVTIELKDNLPQINEASIVLTIEASNANKEVGKTIVILEVKNNLPEDDLISFSEQFYEGKLNVETQDITLDEIMIDTGDVETVKILGDYGKIFDVDYDKNTKVVSLSVSGNLETISEPNVVFTLAAYNAKDEMGQTTVVLSIVGELNKPTPPTFEKTYYEGEFKVEDQSLILEDIRILKGDIESVIIVEKDYNTYFEAKYNKESKLVEIKLLKQLENIMESNIVFSLKASDKYEQSTDATVVLKVLGKNEPEEDKIVFDEHDIGFVLEAEEKLPKPLKPFVAKSTNNKDKIIYKFMSTPPNGIELNENTGVVTIVKILSDHILPVKLGATGSESSKTAETDFVIYSYKLQGSSEKATYSYIAKKVEEGEATTIILEQQNTNFKYCLLERNPNDINIFINEDGNLASKNIDREDRAFENMIVPQYLITVDLVKETDSCDEVKQSRMQKNIIEDINMYDQIENWESRTVVTVLIEDVNDNDPIFDPSEQIVAYPQEEIAKIIRPTYLTKVHATDLDSENNFGKITYSSQSDYVFVNGESGIIYPTDKIFSSNGFEFTVIATDGGGKTNELELQVSLIDKDKISIISFENIDLENVADKLKELSEKSGINLQALSISAVPLETSMLFKDYNYYVQAYVYGVKDSKIVSSNTIKENVEDVTVIEFDPNTSDGCDAEIEECDDSGLIAAVAVLAVLLAVVLAGSIAFYVVKIRNRNATSNDFNHHIDEERIIEQRAAAEKPYNRRSTGYVFNPPPPEDDDVDSNSNNNEKIGDDFDRNLERRKSVSFNDQIETIKIDKTVPAEEKEDSDAKKQ